MGKKKESALHKKLSSELTLLIPQLDEEGLIFLIEQARVHLYNLEIDRFEAENELLSDEKTHKGSAKTTKGSSNLKKQEQAKANFRIEKSADGNNYNLISVGKWKLFNDEEMLSMVKIAQGPDSITEVATRLHLWLMRERPDTFGDLDIGDAHDPKMKELVTFLRHTFAVKNEK